MPRIDAALKEAHRVLRIGGRFLCLEFSTVDVPGLDALYDFYSFNVIPALGRAPSPTTQTHTGTWWNRSAVFRGPRHLPR